MGVSFSSSPSTKIKHFNVHWKEGKGWLLSCQTLFCRLDFTLKGDCHSMDTRTMMEGTKVGVDRQAKRQRTHLLTSHAIDYALMQLQSYKQSWLFKTRQISVKKINYSLLALSFVSHTHTHSKQNKKKIQKRQKKRERERKTERRKERKEIAAKRMLESV